MSESNKSNDMVHVAAIRRYLRAATKFIGNVSFDEFAQDEAYSSTNIVTNLTQHAAVNHYHSVQRRIAHGI